MIKEFDKHLLKATPSIDKFEKASILNYFRQSLLSQRTAILEEVEAGVNGLKTDERKVSVFGKGMDSWEARTYDEKQLVNAVLSAVKQLLANLKK